MNKINKKDYWFKDKRYGIGFIPSTPQGWAVIISYVIIVVGSSLILLKDVPDNTYQAEAGYFMAVFAVSTFALLIISRAKGPTPKWRWGDTDQDNSSDS